MSNNYIGIFDVIGPIMVGPSSSHTSGAASIAWMARQIFTGTPVKATFTLYGSFAETYKGHGTDCALIGGMLGYKPNDVRIRDAYDYAKKEGLAVDFVVDRETETLHPNTVDVVMESADGHTLLIRGESIGGGRARIRRMNNIDVDFTGEFSTLIVSHKDEIGTVAYITKCLAERNVNIASLRMFREEKGDNAVTVIESEGYIPVDLEEALLMYDPINSVDMIEL